MFTVKSQKNEMFQIFLNKTFNSKYYPAGTNVLALGEPPKDKLYSHRLKGMSLSFGLLKNALSGGYVNFGVFRLYNDPALDDVLNIFIKLMMAVESGHLLVGQSTPITTGPFIGMISSMAFVFFTGP